MAEGAAIFAVGAGIVKGMSSIMKGESRAAAIRIRMAQNRLAFEKQTVDDLSRMEKFTAVQVNRSAASGFKYSGSFANLTEQNINEFKLDESARKLNFEMQQHALVTAADNTIAQGFIGAAGNIFKTTAIGMGVDVDGAEKLKTGSEVYYHENPEYNPLRHLKGEE